MQLKPLASKYLDYAAECMMKAAQATSSEAKAALEGLARQWTRLAEHREKIDQGTPSQGVTEHLKGHW